MKNENTNVSLALVMMLKNESKRIVVTLDSVRDVSDCFVILDTGSEDNTVNIVKNYCKQNNKILHLIEKVFPSPFHFSNARNAILDFADDKADYLLLLDCNDELKGQTDVRRFIDNYKGESTAFHICQEWWNGISLDKYFNIRLLKSKNEWRYRGAIHEYIICPKAEEQLEETKRCQTKKKGESLVSRIIGFSLYQDRTKDDDKSSNRFSRDAEILSGEYKKYIDSTSLIENDPNGYNRNLFYYGQTCMCLAKNETAYNLYRERSCQENGFVEEKYHSYFRCGEISKLLNHDWEESMIWYIKAYEYSSLIFDFPRAEPLFRLAEYYKGKCWELSFMYLLRCCDLLYPDNAILFVDRRVYDYKRWHLMSIAAYEVKQYKIGRVACIKAIESENNDIDKTKLIDYNRFI
jgi:glycosyltransferase involved in cell wall biosynthesis